MFLRRRIGFSLVSLQLPLSIDVPLVLLCLIPQVVFGPALDGGYYLVGLNTCPAVPVKIFEVLSLSDCRQMNEFVGLFCTMHSYFLIVSIPSLLVVNIQSSFLIVRVYASFFVCCRTFHGAHLKCCRDQGPKLLA